MVKEVERERIIIELEKSRLNREKGTVFLNKDELHRRKLATIFNDLGKPVVIKAPYTSFSKYVEKAACETSFREVAKKFFKKSDVLAVQEFVPTAFDWRVGVLNDEVLYVCKYMIPKGKWKGWLASMGTTA
jgi:glutathione synthase/RimK-type ligase-like ATP-grasp enzyme